MKGGAQSVPRARIEPFSVPRLCRWTWQVIRLDLVWFWIAALGGLLLMQGSLFQSQLMSVVVARLAFSGGGPGDAGGKSAVPVLDALIPRSGDLRWAVLLLVATIILLKFFDFAVGAADEFLNSRMLRRLQLRLHDKLLRLGPEWHDQRDPGSSTMLVNSLAPGVQATLSRAAQFPVINGIGLASALTLIYVNLEALPQMPLGVRIAGVAALLAIPMISWWLSNRVRAAFQDAMLADLGISTEILNSLSQPIDISALGAVPQRSRRMAERLRAAAGARIKRGLRSQVLTSFMTALPDLLQGLFLAYGVWVTISAPSPAAVAAILAVNQFIPRTMSSLSELIGFYTGLNAQWPDVVAVGRVLDTEPAIRDAPEAGPWPRGEAVLAMRGVAFAYDPGGRRVLDGLDHRFAPDRISAIVGQSGSGKSTILQLILRLREPTEGEIDVAGRPIGTITLEELRRHVVVVSQVSPFLTDSVRENFRLAAAEASDQEIEAACRRTGVWEVLVKKSAEAPLDQSMTREPGKDFSGGERRLIAVTRALLRKPAILLLDEPTTGVDLIHLEQLARALRIAAEGMTVLLIEHNLDFVRGLADEVCVIEKGRFVQVGPPRLLADQPGLFRDLLEARARIVASAGLDIESHPLPTIDVGPAQLAQLETPRIAVGAKRKAMAP